MIRLTKHGKKTKARILRSKVKIRGNIRVNLEDIGRELVKEARSYLSLRKSGRVYNVIVRGKRVRHRASAPGQSPANMTGNLKSKISYRVSGLYMFFESNAEYSRFLEDGTSKMRPRPFMRRAAKKKSRRAEEILTRMRTE